MKFLSTILLISFTLNFSSLKENPGSKISKKNHKKSNQKNKVGKAQLKSKGFSKEFAGNFDQLGDQTEQKERTILIMGGVTNELKAMTDESKDIFERAKKNFRTDEFKLSDENKNLLETEIKFCGYRTQVVAGVNYLQSVLVGDKEYEIKVFEPLPYANQEPFVFSIVEPKVNICDKEKTT